MTTLEEKMSLVHDYYLSDQSRKDYCHSHNINETTLRYYITKHHQIGGSTSSGHPNAPKRQKIVPSVSPEDYSRLKAEYQSLQEKYDQLFEKFNHPIPTRCLSSRTRKARMMMPPSCATRSSESWRI